jgi:opacity protein-like surface antigen
MYKVLIGFVAAAILALGVQPASAQRRTAPRRAPVAQRTPAAGMWAGGGSVGAAAPADAGLKNGLDIAGNLERFFTPRVSLRGQIGASWWDLQGHSFSGTVKPLFATGNAVYNWEGGAVHPYVTGGIGIYHFRGPGTTNADVADTKAGVNVGGGLDYFIDRRTTMGGELAYHKVGAFDTPLAAFGDGSFWRFGFGLKRYF